MLNNSIKMYKPFTKLIQKSLIYTTIHKHSCLCGQIYFKTINKYDIRVHSTQSDQHRQKVVIETSTPKIVYEEIKQKVLPGDDVVTRSFWKDNIDPYVKLARWDRPIGVYLLYWPCAWSIALGSIPGNVPLYVTLQTAGLFLVGAGLMRGAGCTINDLWDRDVDAKVERTKDRPLVTGAISHTQALVFLAAQLSLALGILMQLNCYSVVLGASSMVLVVTYPLAKRFTNYPQIFLGATFNWGALLGYSAIQGNIDLSVCGPLYIGALAWTVVYDTIYAHQDKEDDRRVGIKSTALTFGKHTRPALYTTLAASILCLTEAGRAAELGIGYNVAVMAYAAHALRQAHLCNAWKTPKVLSVLPASLCMLLESVTYKNCNDLAFKSGLSLLPVLLMALPYSELAIYTLDTENPEDCASKFKSNSACGLIILIGILTGGYTKYMYNKQNNTEQHATGSCFFS